MSNFPLVLITMTHQYTSTRKDHSPLCPFLQEYHTRLAEDARFPKSVLTVSATDADTKERGKVRFTLGGEGALLFIINETTGEVSTWLVPY